MESPLGVMVIGYGSPIRGDDAVGPLVADRLMELEWPPGVQIISRHVLTPELVGEVAQVRRVIFLDATEEGPPGRVVCRPLQAAPQAEMAMGHFLDPRELLAWCRDLYGHEPEALLVSVRGDTFEYSSYELSPGVACAVAPMIDCVRQLVHEVVG